MEANAGYSEKIEEFDLNVYGDVFRMNIAITFDGNYQNWATVCLNSIIINSKLTDKIRLFIISDLEEKQFIWQLRKVLVHYNYSIDKLGSDFDHLPTGFHFTKAMYGVLAMPRLLAQKGIKKALYIDLDTLILDDVNKLYSTDLGDYFCAGCLDIHTDDLSLRGRLRLKQDYVINSGVLLMNIDKMNEIEWVKKSDDFRRLGLIQWGDQDIINMILDKKMKVLDQKWNVQSGNFQNGYVGEVSIVHFTESGNTKPWRIKSKHPYLNIYNTYISISRFYFDYLILELSRRVNKFCKK